MTVYNLKITKYWNAVVHFLNFVLNNLKKQASNELMNDLEWSTEVWVTNHNKW